MPILLVDDDVAFSKAVAYVLETSGVMVEHAYSGTEALNKVRGGFKPRIVLLDLLLPDISGMDVLKMLRQEFPEIPVALLTGYPTEALGADKTGAVSVSSKPVSKGDLLGIIEKYGLPEQSNQD